MGRLDAALAGARRRAAHALGHQTPGRASESHVIAAACSLGGPAYAPPRSEALSDCGAASAISHHCRSAVTRQRWERAWTAPAEGAAPQAARHLQQREALAQSVTALLSQVQQENTVLRRELASQGSHVTADAARQAEADELLLWGALALMQ